MRTTALKQVSEHGGPVVLGAGMTLLAVALVTSATHGSITAAPPPSHATTAPPVASPRTTPAPSHTTAPRTTPRSEPAGGNVVAAAASQSGGSSSTQHPNGIAPSGPMPQPPASATPPRCAIGVTALTLNACLKLGGTR
jgi:hypothetical protein